MIIGARNCLLPTNILQDAPQDRSQGLRGQCERAEFFSQEFPDLYVVHLRRIREDIL